MRVWGGGGRGKEKIIILPSFATCATIDRAVRHGPGPREATARGQGGRKRRDVRARHGLGRISLQGVPGEGDLRAREAAKPVQGSEASARSAGALRSASTGGSETTARSAGALRSASTGGSEACARSAGARASASMGGSEACARSAGARASASTGGCERTARSAGAGASASTGGSEACARSAGALRSASTGGGNTAARSAARLATRRLACSAPPSTPSPRFWSSPRTWRTRGRRTTVFDITIPSCYQRLFSVP